MKLRLSSSGKFRLRSAVALAIAGIAAPVTPPPVEDSPIDNTASVTAVAFPEFSGFQRIGTSKNVPISGTCAGSVTSIEARVVRESTGAVVVDWTTVATPSAGTWSGTINTPQGHFYKCEYRARTAAGVSPTVISPYSFGVGIFIGMFGQSNMVNRYSNGLKNPLSDKRARELHIQPPATEIGTWARPGNILDTMPLNSEIGDAGYVINNPRKGRSDGYILLANLLAQALDLPVYLVERADIGSSVQSWDTTVDGNNWDAFASLMDQANGDFEVGLWHQGETNANLMSKATMKTHLAQIMLQCHQYTGRNASNFKFGVVALGPGSYGSSEGEFGNMRAAHVEFATSTPGAYLSTCAHDSQTSDGVHIIGESYSRFGRRDARSLLNQFGFGPSGAGPRVTGATWDGSGVVLTLAHSGGTALLDGAGGNGTALTGFEFKDGAGALIAHTSSAITSATTIRFALPTKPATAAYAMMNNPHNTDRNDSETPVVLASVPYDNVVNHRSTTGCILQPFAPIPVTGA